MTTEISNNKLDSLGLIDNNGETSKNNDWLQCVKWLIDCKCLPQHLVDSFVTHDLTQEEFSNSLRDGVILCNVAYFLLPGSLDTTLINKRENMSQMLCLKNKRLFLDAFKSFNLDQNDLLDECLLYEFDLARVIRALSILSNSRVCSECGIEGFSIMTKYNQQNSFLSSISSLSSSTNLNSSDDNIISIETHQSSAYTDPSFLLGSNDNNAYQIIVQKPQESHHIPKKRDYVIREILNTDENYINGLNTLNDDFLKPLSKVLNDSDRKCICINIDKLEILHQSLYGELLKAVPGGPGMTIRICTVFESFKLLIMKEYSEYFSYINQSIARCNALTDSKNHSNISCLKSITKTSNYTNKFREILEECRHKSKKGSFKLTDLLILPQQRICQYHLLFNELFKQTDVDHLAKNLILKTKDSMNAVCSYLNECKRHKDNLYKIEEIMIHLTTNTKGNSNLNLKDYGHFIKEDEFVIKSIDESIANTRTFLLFEIALIICKKRGDIYEFRETLLIEEYTIENPSVVNSNNNLIMFNETQTKSFTLCFKNQEQKNIWKSFLLEAKQKAQPEGKRFINRHLFKLTNFGHDIVQCNACENHLLGIFYQGYKCSLCSIIAHKDCLLNTSTCCPQIPIPLPNLSATSSFLTEVLCSSMMNLQEHTFDLFKKINEQNLQTAVGTSISSLSSIISSISVSQTNLNSSDDNIIPLETNKHLLEEYPWYASVDRTIADLILNRIQNISSQTLFMVRCRQEGFYAISIKYNGLVEHIKINVNYLDSESKKSALYSIDQLNFSSVIDLVKYYSQNTLKQNFPQLETNLGLPYREALPTPISIALAVNDYNPLTNNTGGQIELKRAMKYYIIKKEPNGWLRVYNSDGLIGYVPGDYLKD